MPNDRVIDLTGNGTGSLAGRVNVPGVGRIELKLGPAHMEAYRADPIRFTQSVMQRKFGEFTSAYKNMGQALTPLQRATLSEYVRMNTQKGGIPYARGSAPVFRSADPETSMDGVPYRGTPEMSKVQKAAYMTMPMPVVGDIAGLAADAEMYINDPDSRSLFNYFMTGLGALGLGASIPPASMTRRVSDGAAPGSAGGGGLLSRNPLGDQYQTGRVISERMPTAKGATEDPMGSFLRADMEAMRQSPEQTAKVAGLIRKYPNFNSRVRSPDQVIDLMKQHSVENLNFIYNNMDPAIREQASLWYDGANRLANEFSGRFGIGVEPAAGVIAALSPQKDWYQNVSLAERVIDAYTNQRTLSATPEMVREASSVLKNKNHLAVFNRIKGARLGDLEDPVERAIWIRIFDQAHNDRSYNIMSPSGEVIGKAETNGGKPRKAAWGSFSEIAKAIRVLDNPSLENISLQMGGQHKVRNFYNNIADPYNKSSITADTHAVAGALLRPLSGSSTEVMHNLGAGPSSALTGVQGSYPVIADAYRDAAAEHGVLPRQMQSIAWEGIRGMYTPEMKRNKGLQGNVSDILREFKKGQINQRQMQEALINESGGIRNPSWYR